MQTHGRLINRILKIMMLLSVAVCMMIPSRAAFTANASEKTLVITVVDDEKQETQQVDTDDSDLNITVIEEESTPLAAAVLINKEPACIGHLILLVIALIVLIAGSKSANAKRAEIRRLRVRLKTARAKGE